MSIGKRLMTKLVYLRVYMKVIGRPVEIRNLKPYSKDDSVLKGTVVGLEKNSHGNAEFCVIETNQQKPNIIRRPMHRAVFDGSKVVWFD